MPNQTLLTRNSPPRQTPKRLTPAVVSAIAILNHLQSRSPNPLGVAEIARTLGLNVGTCHAILQTLVHNRYVIQNPLDKTYSLGPALVRLGAAAAGDERYAEAVRAPLPALTVRTGLNAMATKLLPDAHMVTIARAESSRPFQLSSPPGSTFPLSPSAGKVFLAWVSPPELQKWLSLETAGGFGPASAAECADYLEQLRLVREQGYAWTIISAASRPEIDLAEIKSWLERAAAVGLDRPSEESRALHVEQVRRLGELPTEHHPYRGLAPTVSVTAPVFDDTSRVVLGISIFGFASEIPPERVPELAEEVRSAAGAITAAIGGREPREIPS
jgi:DNA-binding IclR family transcriptional regulator